MTDLRTERLELRKLTADTAAAFTGHLADLDSDPEVMRHLTGRPTPRAHIETVVVPGLLAEAEHHPQLGCWLAFEDDAFAGWFALAPSVPDDRVGETPVAGEVEVGYRLRRAVWGRGLATEGTRALISHAFGDLGLTRVWAQTMAVNTRSRAVLERCGLTPRRTFHADYPDPLPGAEQGEVEYDAVATTWSTVS